MADSFFKFFKGFDKLLSSTGPSKASNNFKKPPNNLNPCFNASSQISITLIKIQISLLLQEGKFNFFKTLFVFVKNSLCIGYEFSVYGQLKIMQECVLLPNKKEEYNKN